MNIGHLFFHGPRNEKLVALTFDDAPSSNTKKLLDLLKRKRVKATFFIVGKNINGREHIIKRMNKEGHEIANHSYTHSGLWYKSLGFIHKEIELTDRSLLKLGIKSSLFRPPYFHFGLNAWIVTHSMKKKVIFCDVSSDDWKLKGVDYPVNRVIDKTKGGSIINLHDYLEKIGNNPHILKITAKIIDGLKDRGYKFTTVSKLIKIS